MGKTIMISSHILSELEEICDHVGIIEHGQLVFSGTLEEIRPRLGIESKVRVRVADRQDKAVELLATAPGVNQHTLCIVPDAPTNFIVHGMAPDCRAETDALHNAPDPNRLCS